MGYHIHHAIVVTNFDENRLARAHTEALSRFKDSPIHVTPMTDSGVNGYCSFLVPPDGSKEGWEPSNECDDLRESYCQWLTEHSDLYCDWVYVAFGGDEGWCNTKIVDHNDAPTDKEPDQ